jgi:hypothetical protein
MSFFSDVFAPGAVVLITATMRAGKSNLASFLIEMGVPLGYHFYTNMLFYDYDEIDNAVAEGILKQKKSYYRRVPPEVHTATAMSEFFLGLNSTRQNISLLDESLLFAASKKGSSRDIRWFEGFITQIGKFRSSIALIAQAKSKLATIIKEDIPSIEFKVFKVSYYHRYAEIWYNPPQSGENAEESYKLDEWDNIPASRYPYDSYAPAGFDYDIDVEALINRISKMKTLQVRKELPRIIDELLHPVEKPKQMTIKDIITELIQDDPSVENEDIMKHLKEMGRHCSNTYINTVRKEAGIYLS